MSAFFATAEFAVTELESSAIIIQYVGTGSIIFFGQAEFGPGFSFQYEGVGSIVFYGYSWVSRVEQASKWERVSGSGNI